MTVTESPIDTYYDSDYQPFDEATPEHYGVMGRELGADVEFYRALARQCEGPVLELFAGTGRIAIPLARDGHDVTAVDLSPGMLRQLHDKLHAEPEELRRRIHAVEADARTFSASEGFSLVIIPYNSLALVPDFRQQRAVLAGAFRNLHPDGTLVLHALNLATFAFAGGDLALKPVLTRRNLRTGNIYTRWGGVSQCDAEQRQRHYGWYDEVLPDRTVKRSYYQFQWRLCSRFELELMIVEAGFTAIEIAGGFSGQPFDYYTRNIVVTARKPRLAHA